MHYTHGDPYFYTLFVMCIVLILLGFMVIYSFCFVWVMKVLYLISIFALCRATLARRAPTSSLFLFIV
jgi:hypothetical protein